MTRSSTPASEPRRIRGGAGGVGRGQWVRYPLRLVYDTEVYADADTKVYGKVKALSKDRMCEASVARLAEFTGLSVSAVEKALTRLSRPAPTDGVRELTRRQRSHRVTGKGRTNERDTRPLDVDERYVCAPVRAADTLRGILHRLYLLLRYTILVEHREPTLGEIGDVLRHHGGKTAGQPLHEGTVARLLDELEGAGWITQDKRAGYRGRHTITVHDDPVRPVDEPDGPPPATSTPPASTPDAECGAAPDPECGAPAYKEDHELTDLAKDDAELGGSFRRRRGTGSYRPDPVDTFGNPITPRDYYPVASTAVPIPPRRRPYDGPGLEISGRVWAVLEPAHDLLPGVREFVLRRAVREIARHLDTGVPASHIRDRITRLRHGLDPAEITDPGRWLLGALLPRPPRGHPPHTGPTPVPVVPLLECPGCTAPYRPPLRHPTCRLCRTPLPDTA